MFRIVAMLTAFVCLVLFLILLASPAAYVSTYGVAPDAGASFMVRRASPMFAGFALILWLARNAQPSVARTAIGLGIAVAFAGVALTGMAEFLAGTASVMIVAAAMGETLIAVLFVVAIRGR